MNFALSLAAAACPAAAGELLSVTEAAAAARVTSRTLSNYWLAGEGPARTRVGGRVFISRSALIAWLASRTDESHQPTSPPTAA
jgi:helix-turn-helix protein